MVEYTKYGMKRLDHISSSTMSASHSITINDTAQSYKSVWVVGSIQMDAESLSSRFALLSSDGTKRQCANGTAGGASTNRVGSTITAPFTDVNLSFWTQSNDNYTTYSGHMLHFMMMIYFDRSTSKPFSRIHGVFQTINSTPNANMSRGGFECTEDVAITDVLFQSTNQTANVTLNATSYGMLASIND